MRRLLIDKIRLKDLSLKVYYCAICDANRVFIKLRDDEVSIRCTYCRASSISIAVAGVLREYGQEFESTHAYELSARGPLLRFLQKSCRYTTCSEHLPDVPLGAIKNGIQCQDVQRLTYPANCFDLCTSTEVFEHVADDTMGFREIHRVLRAGGVLALTVPFTGRCAPSKHEGPNDLIH